MLLFGKASMERMVSHCPSCVIFSELPEPEGLVRFSSAYFTGESLWKKFLEQFDDKLVKILLFAAVVSLV
jgi:hypothetical protein